MSHLKNFDNVLHCLPGFEGYTQNSDSFDCKIRLDISSVASGYLSSLSGRLKVSIPVINNDSIDVVSSGRVAGSPIKIEVSVKVIPVPTGSEFRWKSVADFGILSRLLTEKKVLDIAEMNISNTIECLKAHLIAGT